MLRDDGRIVFSASKTLREPKKARLLWAWWLPCGGGDGLQVVLSALPPSASCRGFERFSSPGVSNQSPSGLQKPDGCWCLPSTPHPEGELSVRRRQEVEESGE